MKTLLIAVLSIAFGSYVLGSPLGGVQKTSVKQWPTECASSAYWCQNLTTAKNCGAVKHCIQAVWEKQKVPVDNDSVCQICLDMVKQARDQLESNETQDDLRAVFEGSCQLIYVKPIVHECIRLVDNFIPELIEALASQMNPQVVCSVAGLCNNAHIDLLLAANKPAESVEGKEFTCGKCSSISSTITSKFHSTSRDTVLENMLEMCGQMGTFSDACSSIILTYFNEIYNHMSDNLTPDSLCHLTGACAGKYHQHPELVEVRPMSNVGRVNVQDDIPCELCEQLVNHLRDLLTANTTESEFKTVLEGLCNQTQGFKEECTSLVDQYYAEIYEFITKSLDSEAACFYIGVCPKGKPQKGQIAPLVPFETQVPQHKKNLLGADEPKFTDEEIASFQLPVQRLMAKPIDHLMGAPNGQQLVNGGEWCTMCEYAMHFVQEELADGRNEEQIKEAVMKTCKKMPSYLRGECDNFVELYGDALIALLVQSVDPATVCPEIKLCPRTLEKDSELFTPSTIAVEIHSESMNKGSCPLCLLAVEQAQTIIQQDKTEEKVKSTLKGLCSHLKNKKLNLECQDFVDTYSKELIELLMRDFTPQEICVYLKLCTDTAPEMFGLQITAKNDRDQEIETNEIADNTIDGILISSVPHEVVADTPECMLCKEVVKEVEQRVVNKTSKAEIKNALEHACDKIPKKAKAACQRYIEEHGDRIAELIQDELSPKEICRDLQLCMAVNMNDDLSMDDAVQVTVYTSPVEAAPVEGSNCIVCEMIIARMDNELKKPATKAEVKAYLDSVCSVLPKSYKKSCDRVVEQYADLIIETFEHIPPKEICTEIAACKKMNDGAKNEVYECAICNGVVTALDGMLNDQGFVGKVEDTFELACKAVSARYQERCQKMIQVYGISMIEQLKQDLESDKICVNIGMCYSEEASGFVQMNDEDSSESDSVESDELIVPRKVTLVGENECTWGPSHWCKDEETANKCNSVEFCKKKSLGKWSA